MSKNNSICVETLVNEKLMKGGKKCPRVVVWLLKKLIHEDFLNDILKNCEGEGAEFCGNVLKYLGISVEVEGLEKVPCDGTLYTFAGNHPLGGIDGMAMCSIIGKRFTSIRLLVNDFLMYFDPLKSISIPINKVGGQVRNLPQLVDDIFKSEDQVLIFPAGLCSRKIKNKVQDLPWSKTFIIKSKASNRVIVPFHFIGENSRRFYSIANISKFLGLKFNVAMLFLFDEVYKAKGKNFKVVFGEPIPIEHFDNSKNALQWAASVRDLVYTLE